MVKLAPPTLKKKSVSKKTYQPDDAPDLSLEPGAVCSLGSNVHFGAPRFDGGTAPIVFDIETGPLADDVVLSRIKPYPPMEEYGDIGSFDVNSVKLGNLKDETKKEAKRKAAREEHNRQRKLGPKLHEESYRVKKAEYEAKAIEKAALRAETGRVLAIGYLRYEDDPRYAIQWVNRSPSMQDAEERHLLSSFWAQYRVAVLGKTRMVGLNIFGFDLPFLVRRSWLLGVEVPIGVRPHPRFWNDGFIDLGESWLCGQRGDQPWSLDYLSRCFGGPGKIEGIDGSDFARLLSEDRDQAAGYLLRDLDETYFVATKLGIAG